MNRNVTCNSLKRVFLHVMHGEGDGGEQVELEPVRHPAEAHVPTGGGYWARVVNAGTVARWRISS